VLPALTSLRLSCRQAVDVSGLAGLRRLEVRAVRFDPEGSTAVEGLPGLAALEDLSLDCGCGPLAQPSDLAPLTALTRLAMTCVPPELGSLPVAARLRQLELQAFGVLFDAPGGGNGSGANGAAEAALEALAHGAPLLERLRIHASCYGRSGGAFLMDDQAAGVELGAPLGPDVTWPSLTHLHVTPWAARLLAGCAFPRLSRLAACVAEDEFGNRGIAANEPQRAAIAALAAKARDYVALQINNSAAGPPDGASVLAAAATIPGLRHLSWVRSWTSGGAAEGDWARLAASLESLELMGPVAAFGYAEPLAALTGLTHLFLAVTSNDTAAAAAAAAAGGAGEGGEPPVGPAGGAPARTARALAGLPRLSHLRLAYPHSNVRGATPDWVCPAVAAELARCPALWVLEIDRLTGPLWRHERLGPPYGPGPRMPLPSPAWPPFVEALRAGGFRGPVRPAPEYDSLGLGLETARFW
jgi:hypothetical protein